MNKIYDVQFGSLSYLISGLEENKQIMKRYKVDSKLKKKDVMDEFAQLNSILDEHFEELTIKTPIPIINSFTVLLSLIAHRSPNLKKLSISFLKTSYKLVNLSSESMIVHDFISLSCLTSLNLQYDTSLMVFPTTYEDPFSGNNQSILSVVGKCCPILTKLKVTLGFPLKKRDVLGLILGERSNLITDDDRWGQDSVLVGLQIPTELLNPLCLTLQELALSSNSGGTSSWFQPYRDAVHPSSFVYAFALRHLPNLRKIGLWTSIIDLLKIIHKVNQKIGIHQQHQQAEFEENCRSIKDSITSPTPFTCKLL